MKRIIMLVAVLIAAGPVYGQELSEETLRLQSIERIILAQQATIQEAIKKIGGGSGFQLPAPPQPQVIVDTANIATACSSTGGFDMWRCGLQLLASPSQGLVDIVAKLAGPGASIYGAKVGARTAMKAAEMARDTSIAMSRDSNATLQTAFQQLGSAAGAPSTVTTINGSQGVSVGDGEVVWAPVSGSYNPQNPNPAKPCTLVPGPNNTWNLVCPPG